MSGAFDLIRCPLEGTRLIEASAGTGKTHALAGLFLRLVAEMNLDVDKILVVTFTEAATAELRQRIRRLIRAAMGYLERGEPGDLDPVTIELIGGLPEREKVVRRLREAGIRFDEAPIHTIHGFCRSLLAEHAFESGAPLGAELVLDDTALIREATDDFWRRRIPDAPRIWLRGALSSGRFSTGPDGLTPLLALRSLDPGARVLPQGAAPDLDPAEGGLREAHQALRNVWRVHGAEIRELVGSFPGWHGGKFGPSRRAAALEALSTWMEDGDPGDLGLAVLAGDLSQSRLETRVKKGYRAPQHGVFRLCEEAAARAQELATLHERYTHVLERVYLDWVPPEVARRKRRQGLWAFDDLLAETYRALSGPRGERLAAQVSRRYAAALVDEFQDTDPLQYRIFEKVFREQGCLLYLIGDPKQAIYGFRGADIHAYLRAARSVEGHATLSVNRRSTPELVRSVNGLFGGHARPFLHPEIGFLASTASRSSPARGRGSTSAAGIVIRYRPATRCMTRTEAQRHFAEDGASAVGDLLLEGFKPSQIAVLVRTNRQAQTVQDTLRLRGIPGVVYAAGSVFGSDEAAEVERILVSLLRPTSESALRSALATNALGYDAPRLAGLSSEELDTHLDMTGRHHDLWVERGFLPAFRSYLDKGRVRETLLGLPDGERRLTNLLHLGELAHTAQEELHLGPEELLAWLQGRRFTPERNEEEELRLESDAKAVVISTIHRSKGLEYDAVVCPFLWDGHRPGSGAIAYHEDDGTPVLDLEGSERARLHHFGENLSESLRLLYVALTRARHACRVSWGWVKDLSTSPLFYILHCRDMDPSPGDTGIPQAMRERDARLTAGSMTEDLVRLEKAGIIRLYAPVPDLPLSPPHPQGAATGAARTVRRTVWDRWSVASYTGLTRGRHQDAPARDVDADVMAPAEPLPGPETEMLGFPRGARAGSFLHAVLERADFSPRAPDPLAWLEALCGEWGYEGHWAPALATMIRSIAGRKLGAHGAEVVLADVPRSHRLTELEFHLPVDRLDPARLAGVFQDHGQEMAGLAHTIRGLGFPAMRGYMRGFIDSVVVSGGRYYVLDWKSNYLGARPEAYAGASLATSMDENLYTLQHVLYEVALYRYLLARSAAVREDPPLGGAFYVFLRGVRPDWPGSGVIHVRTPPTLVHACDRLLGGRT